MRTQLKFILAWLIMLNVAASGIEATGDLHEHLNDVPPVIGLDHDSHDGNGDVVDCDDCACLAGHLTAISNGESCALLALYHGPRSTGRYPERIRLTAPPIRPPIL